MFDWGDYEKLAKSLKNGDEAAKRTAISRLYYSIYHRALIKLEQTTDFIHSENKPAHQQVWERYSREGRTLSIIGRSGKVLRDYRDKADYDAEIDDLDRTLEGAQKLTETILYWLNQVQPRSPTQ